MAKRGRKGRGHYKAKTSSFPVRKQLASATSISNVATPRVHPATNDCYPLNKLCRLCLLSNINMEPIFSYPGDDHLAQKIFQCTNLEIKENADNGIPTSLCGQCKKQLDQCYEFRLLCWKNNEILHNLHAILSPTKKVPQPVMRSNPVVQVEKLNLSPSLMPTPAKRGKPTINSFGEIPLSQLYTPSRRGHKAVKTHPQFTKELVVRLSPVPASLISKFKKTTVTQTKAAMKSFPQSPRPRGRPKGSVKATAKPVVKRVAKPIVKHIAKPIAKPIAKLKVIPKTFTKSKVEKKVVVPVAAKKHKAKRAEIAVPPKKRKENFQTAPTVTTATCVLCTQAFNSVKSLSRHMATHENNRKNNRVFNCDVCKKEYLKASQLTDHLRSADHVENAARNGANFDEISILPDESEAEVSILPDDTEVSILPDDHSTAEVNVSVESSENAEQEPEEITDRVADETERCQPSPDTNDNSQQNEPAQEDVVNDRSHGLETNVQPEAEINTNRDASPIPVDSDSSRSLEGGVQYSDVCSTNNAENLLNGSGADPFNASRRVTFSDITEIVE
ncbi:zinc finger protein pita-like isoform X2 [Ochlerotatus camptorhynchus]|uniref:zinc finger protein pita-like isoform X2 n=1 Tax=Ochlerotatus camptorhynchus TaxID=644619 RepID=UPI0031DA6172